MKALVVSRVGLNVRIIENLKKSGIKEFEDYFKYRDGWETADDIISVAKERNCDAVVIITNFKLAVEILAKGIKPVFVIVPKRGYDLEIISASIYELYGDVTAVVTEV